jgi:inhibitor of KinA
MTELSYPVITPVGEDSILIEYEEMVCPEVNLKVRQLSYGLEQGFFAGLKEVVPAYRSVMVYFDPFQVDFDTVQNIIKKVADHLQEINLPAPRLFRIPTVYGGGYGPDLERVAEFAKVNPDEVIQIFSSQRYPVYCLGFLCSLAYLGGVPKILQIPRLASPRTSVPAGSVGFAGPQANILPIDTPSGFNYIGRTFVAVYDPIKFPPTLIQPGDYIQCPSVSEEEALRAGRKGLGEFILERV